MEIYTPYLYIIFAILVITFTGEFVFKVESSLIAAVGCITTTFILAYLDEMVYKTSYPMSVWIPICALNSFGWVLFYSHVPRNWQLVGLALIILAPFTIISSFFF